MQRGEFPCNRNDMRVLSFLASRPRPVSCPSRESFCNPSHVLRAWYQVVSNMKPLIPQSEFKRLTNSLSMQTVGGYSSMITCHAVVLSPASPSMKWSSVISCCPQGDQESTHCPHQQGFHRIWKRKFPDFSWLSAILPWPYIIAKIMYLCYNFTFIPWNTH